jgi:hypothetical protein
MQVKEALTRVIDIADRRQARDRATIEGADTSTLNQEWLMQFEANEVAISICQAMLNTAMPIAKYRAFIEIETDQPKRTKYQDSVAAKHEWLIASVNIEGILSGLMSVTHVNTNVRVSLFEQRATGADMLTAYQGESKSASYRAFLKSLPALDQRPVYN